MDAAERGDTCQLSRMLERGADPNARDVDGSTLVQLACEEGHAKAIALLHDTEERRGWAVSTPELVPLWYAAVRSRAEAAAGKNLTVLELVKLRRENPPPPALDFGGAT